MISYLFTCDECGKREETKLPADRDEFHYINNHGWSHRNDGWPSGWKVFECVHFIAVARPTVYCGDCHHAWGKRETEVKAYADKLNCECNARIAGEKFFLSRAGVTDYALEDRQHVVEIANRKTRKELPDTYEGFPVKYRLAAQDL